MAASSVCEEFTRGFRFRNSEGNIIYVKKPDCRLFINNTFCDSTGEDRIDIYDPSTSRKICSVPAANESDINLACEAAKNAFESTSWQLVSAGCA